MHTFLDLSQEALSKFGSNFRIGNHLEGALTKTGFINVSAKKLKVPIGTWPKVSSVVWLRLGVPKAGVVCN